MIRIRRVFLAATMAALLTLGTAGPALAAEGGSPQPGSCGIGRDAAHSAIAIPDKPGATEVAKFPPSEAGCTGN